nr:pyruvate formate lyase family protein [Candidatus Freyarchaeota archaeon]
MLKETEIWSPSKKLSPRIKRLRDEYWNFEKRDYFRNEAISYTTGTPWDTTWIQHNFASAPELLVYGNAVEDSFNAMAVRVDLPEGFWDEPQIVRQALFFQNVLKLIPVQILEGDLIAGAHFAVAQSLCLNQAEAADWKARDAGYMKRMKRFIDLGIGTTGPIPGHLVPDYPKPLRIGFKGIKEEAEKELKRAVEQEKKDFLRAVIICCEAVKEFTHRYAEEARKLAEAESDAKRKGELLEMARICDKVPWNPAGSFWEAVQGVWFTHMLCNIAESYIGAGLSHGRFDQYMFPYYDKDIKEGKLTRDQAKGILECFWVKHNYAYDYFGLHLGRQGITSGYGQLMTISGLGPDGKDATNDLSWLLVDVIEEMNLLEPKTNIRIHKDTPDDFLMRLVESINRCKGGSPSLLNFDSICVKALEWEGLSHEEALDYGVVGCLENTSQGNDRSGTVDVNVNLAKPIELVLNNGKDVLTGEQIGPETGDPASFKTFDEFLNAYKIQLKNCLRLLIELNMDFDTLRATYEGVPYLSAIVGDCIKKGKDVNAGGPKYNFTTVEGVGIATATDSLAAVKKLVYEDKKITMQELAQAIKTDFIGNEKLRQMLINDAPKFGNDDDYVDLIGRDISRFWSEEVFKYQAPVSGRRFRAGYLSWNYFIDWAPKTASTPDGRVRGTYLSNGVQPVQGRDKSGPTASLKSVAKLGFDVTPNGASCVIQLSPSSLRDKEHLKKLASLLRAFDILGGTALMTNVIDSATLREAQKNPEKYLNLLVRVTGYSAYFVTLGKAIQEEIIARTEHAM